MGKRITLKLTMELLSDAIFGSGFSVPGGEDVGVCTDGKGYPYLKGSTLKGLLRESLENLLYWMGESGAALDEILGKEGWNGTADGRRLTLSPLTLIDPPADPEECFGTRTFTALENGVVKTGTLRTARCIRSGLRFAGELCCDEADEALICDALRGVKWAGTMRSRGFGSVRFAAKRFDGKECSFPVGETHCIRYTLRTETPVLSTDRSRSSDNSYETYGYIAGSSVRGMVMTFLNQQAPEFFAQHKDALLSDHVCFLDAVPNPGEQTALPSPMGFYEDKAANGPIESVVKDGNFTAGYKRAKLGKFCVLDGDTIRYWSAKTDGVTRIKRDIADKQMFQTRYLSAGQEFEGYILLEDAALAQSIADAFSGEVRLGADRYAGYGRCSALRVEAAEAPAWINAYPYSPSQVIYLLAVSPFTMLNELGEPCGIDEAALADILGVSSAKIVFCSTSVAEFGSYNRTWQCREATVRMYERGSIFKIECDRAPAAEAVAELQRLGLGIRREAGFGQVLCLTPERFEALKTKRSAAEDEAVRTDSNAALLRRAKYRWIRANAAACGSGLSRSQLGSVQAVCEEAIRRGGDTEALYAFLDKNLNDRGAAHGRKFRKISELICTVMEKPLSETLQLDGTAGGNTEKLELLVMLFDFSRKEKEGENDGSTV